MSQRTERVDELLEQLLGDLGHVHGAVHRGQQQRELVAAQARHRVALAQRPEQPLRDALEQAVAHAVAQRVVDDLEAVQVQEQHGQPLARAVRVGHRHRETVVEQHPVGQAGERVLVGQAADTLLRPLALGDVEGREQQRRRGGIAYVGRTGEDYAVPFGNAVVMQSDDPRELIAVHQTLRERPDIAPQRFSDLGITLAVLEPGRASGLYHAESAQEDFLILRAREARVSKDEEIRQSPLARRSFETALRASSG